MEDTMLETLCFEKIGGKEEYCVTGLGNVSDVDIVIPSTYKERRTGNIRILCRFFYTARATMLQTSAGYVRRARSSVILAVSISPVALPKEYFLPSATT